MPRSKRYEKPNSEPKKRFIALSGDLDPSTPQGASQYSDNMRRITAAINELSEKIDKTPSTIPIIPPVPITVTEDGGSGGGGGEGDSDIPSPPRYEFHNIGGAPGESWAYTAKSGNTFHVYFRTIRGINGISVWTNYDENVIYVSGKELEVHVAYGDVSGSPYLWDHELFSTILRVAPYTLYRARQVLHFGGDPGAFEPDPAYHLSPYDSDKPRLPTIVYAAESINPIGYFTRGIGLELFRVARIKTYAIPLLRIIGSPEHWDAPEEGQITERSKDHTTRIQFFSSDTIEFRVQQHPDYQYGAKVWANCLRTYTATNLDCTLSGDQSGPGYIYKELVSNEFRFRSIIGQGLRVINLDNCVLLKFQISGSLRACSTGSLVFYDDSYDPTTGTHTLRFKGIKAGDNVTITDNGCDIIIEATDTDTQYEMANVGTGAGIWRDTTGTNPKTFNLRSLVAGTNITITQGTDTITISATYPGYTAANLDCEISGDQSGPGYIYKELVSNEFRFRSIIGQGLRVINLDNCVLLRFQIAGSLRACSTGSLVFYDDSYDPTTGTHTLRFKGIKAGDNITITDNGCDIIIEATDTDTQYNMANVGTGAGIWRDTTGTNPQTFNLRSLVAGANVTITQGTDTITISATDTDTQYNMANVGTGAGIWRDTTGTNPKTFNLRSLVAGANVTITQGTNTITISATDTDTQYNMANVGAGAGIWRDTTGTNPKTFNLRSLVAGANVTITQDDDTITISATDTDTQYEFHNIGDAPGESWAYTTQSGSTFHVYFRTIRGINGISVWTNYDENVIYVSGKELEVHVAYGDISGSYHISDHEILNSTFQVSPYTLYRARQVLHFGGDPGAFEPDPTYHLSPYESDKPRLPTVVYAAKSINPVGYFTSGIGLEYFQVARIKTYATPLLRIIGSPEHWDAPEEGQITERSKDHTTRIQFFSSDSIEFRVQQHPDYQYGAKVWANCLRTYTATNLDCTLSGDQSGPGYIYKELVSNEFRFRSIIGQGLRVINLDNCVLLKFQIAGSLRACSTGSLIFYDDSYDPTTGTHTLRFKGIKAGDNVTITDNGCDIIIEATDTDTQYEMANVGTGAGIWRDTTGTNPKTFNLRSLVAGANVTITQGTDTITISATDTDTQYNMTNVGTGAGIWRDTTGTNPKTFNLRSLVAGANVTITQGTNTITISATDTDTQYNMANVGTGAGIWRDTTGTNPKTFNLRSLVAGANVTITQGTDTITISATDTDTQYEMTNVGTGAGIWRDTTGTNPQTFNLRSLVAGTNITITQGTDTITISATYPGYTATNLDCELTGDQSGPGYIYKELVSNEFRFRSIIGQGLRVINLDNCVLLKFQIAGSLRACSTGSLIFYDDSYDPTTGTHTLRFKGIKAGDNITITDNGCDIIIESTDTDTQYEMANVGTGAGIWRDTTGTNPQTFNLRSLVAGANVTITQGTDTITISATDTDTQYEMANVGTGAGIWRNTTGTNPKTFNLRSLVAGTNITITQGTDTITISATYPGYTATNLDCELSGDQSGPGYIYKELVSNEFRFRSIIGQGLRVINLDNCVLLKFQIAGSLRACSTGSLIFYDDDYDPTTGTHTLRFKGIKAGDNITITDNGCDIIIEATDTDTQYEMANVGTGAGIWRDTTGTNPQTFNLRSLVAGANVTITQGTDTITISATDTDTQYNMTNVGTGAGIWRDTTGTNPKTFNLRSLVAGANVTITQGTDTITISSANSQYQAANVGPGVGIWRDTTGTNPQTFNFRSLVAGPGILITEFTDYLTIAALPGGTIQLPILRYSIRGFVDYTNNFRDVGIFGLVSSQRRYYSLYFDEEHDWHIENATDPCQTPSLKIKSSTTNYPYSLFMCPETGFYHISARVRIGIQTSPIAIFTERAPLDAALIIARNIDYINDDTGIENSYYSTIAKDVVVRNAYHIWTSLTTSIPTLNMDIPCNVIELQGSDIVRLNQGDYFNVLLEIPNYIAIMPPNDSAGIRILEGHIHFHRLNHTQSSEHICP